MPANELFHRLKLRVLVVGAIMLLCAGIGTAYGFGTKAAISVAREDIDADNVPDHLGSLYEIKGRITRWNYNTDKTEIFIQDTNDNAGIFIYNMDPFQSHLGGNYSTGKQITVSGYIEQTNGITALRPQFLVEPMWINISDPTPAPIPPVCDTITNFMSNPEGYEGTLVCISNVTVSSGSLPDWNGWGILNVSDGADEINLFIDEQSDMDGQLSPTGTFDIVGIFSQYDTEEPLDSGYQIWPRWYRDFLMTTNNQRPQIHVEDSNTLSAAAGDQIIIELLGQDRNPADNLLLTVLEGPAASSVATNGNREFEYRWTPAVSDAGKSTNVVLHISDGALTNTVSLQVFVLSEEYSNIRLNEIHWDPVNNILGDADGSGDRDANEDEFVEIVNNNTAANISMGGWKLKFGTNVSFTFPPGMVLTAKTAVVLFGGGSPQGTFGGAQVFSPATWAALANSPNGKKSYWKPIPAHRFFLMTMVRFTSRISPLPVIRMPPEIIVCIRS